MARFQQREAPQQKSRPNWNLSNSSGSKTLRIKFFPSGRNTIANRKRSQCFSVSIFQAENLISSGWIIEQNRKLALFGSLFSGGLPSLEIGHNLIIKASNGAAAKNSEVPAAAAAVGISLTFHTERTEKRQKVEAFSPTTVPGKKLENGRQKKGSTLDFRFALWLQAPGGDWIIRKNVQQPVRRGRFPQL